jgi:glycosyltransferase involved in cell wall biosynthesis
VGGTPEVITHDVNGWIVPVQNPPALGDAICGLLADPDRRRRLGQAARTHVMATHTIARLVDRTADLYRDLLARGRRRIGPAFRHGLTSPHAHASGEGAGPWPWRR